MQKNREHSNLRHNCKCLGAAGTTSSVREPSPCLANLWNKECTISTQSVKVPIRGHQNEDQSLSGRRITFSKTASLDDSKIWPVVFSSVFSSLCLWQPEVEATLIQGEWEYASATGDETTLRRSQEQIRTVPQGLSSGPVKGSPGYNSRFCLGRMKLCTEYQIRL